MRPLYTYQVDYQPHPTLSALQQVLVSVLGPLGTQVAYAAILPAGSLTKPVTLLLGYSSTATIALDRGSNTLYVRMVTVNGGAYPSRDYKFALGSSKAIGNFNVGGAFEDGSGVYNFGLVTFTDSNFSSSPHFCQLFITAGPTLLGIAPPNISGPIVAPPSFSPGTYDISSFSMCRALP